jgi:hypothetical protein
VTIATPRSVELHWMVSGRCECATTIIGNYTPECEHWTECEYGRLGDNAQGDPRKGLEDLLLAPLEYVLNLLETKMPVMSPAGGANSVTQSLDGKIYAHIDFGGVTTSYELEPAHYKGEPDVFMIGRRVK